MRAAADELFEFRVKFQDEDDSDTATLVGVPELPYQASARIDRHKYRIVDVRY